MRANFSYLDCIRFFDLMLGWPFHGVLDAYVLATCDTSLCVAEAFAGLRNYDMHTVPGLPLVNTLLCF